LLSTQIWILASSSIELIWTTADHNVPRNKSHQVFFYWSQQALFSVGNWIPILLYLSSGVGVWMKWYYNLMKTEPNTEAIVWAGTKLGNIRMKFVMIGLMLQNVCLFVICPSCPLMLVKYCTFLFEVKHSFGQWKRVGNCTTLNTFMIYS